MTEESLDKLTAVLKNAYDVRGNDNLSPQFDANVMHRVRTLSSEDSASASAPLFLRFSFAALLLAVVVHASYRVSFIENEISISALTQLDPLDLSGDVDE